MPYRLAVYPIRAADRPPSLPGGVQAADGPVAPTWGRPKATQSGGVLLAPLPGECKCGLPDAQPGLFGTGPPRFRPCASPSTSPTSRRIPEPYCGCARAWGSRRTLSSRPDFRPPIALFRRAGMDYLDAVRSSGTPRGGISRSGGGGRHRLMLFTTGAATSYLDHRFAPTTCCCSAANLRACRQRSIAPPMPGSSSRCGRACARSTSRSPPPWPPARHCGRRVVLMCFRHPEVRAKRASKGDGRGARAVSFEGRFAATSG